MVWTAPPPKLPGEDITATVNTVAKLRDSTIFAPPPTSSQSPTWLELAMKTWDAPQLSQQIEEDPAIIPVGKGGIFIPRFSDPALEPTIQINDSTGKLHVWGETGKKYTALPGEYSVFLGNGTVNQRIVKKLFVVEGKTIPVVPDWCGLSIDVVDETKMPFRGSYEMVRLDDFQAFGRSYGRDITRGERVKTWILKPGLYKIFSAGESYNTLNDFITVRLVPGEFVRVIVIENQTTFKILSGGVVSGAGLPTMQPSTHWKQNLNIGGNIIFNSINDKVNHENIKKVMDAALLTLFDLTYRKGSNDWQTNIFWQEEFTVSDLQATDIAYKGDDFRITSLAVWRVILPWLGPYFRTKFQMHFFPTTVQFDKNAPNHFFIILNPDTSVQKIDSINTSIKTRPSFSPITGEAGVGTNIDMFTRENYDIKLRLGMGYSRTKQWSQKFDWTDKFNGDSSIADTINRKISLDSTITQKQFNDALTRNYKVVYQSNDMTIESYGPEFGLALDIRAGRWIEARGDFRMRIPLSPLFSHNRVLPDWDVNTTLSWALARGITLDYLFQYTLINTLEKPLVNQNSHSFFLRFSISGK
jgi:hypothetical protein